MVSVDMAGRLRVSVRRRWDDTDPCSASLLSSLLLLGGRAADSSTGATEEEAPQPMLRQAADVGASSTHAAQTDRPIRVYRGICAGIVRGK